MALSFLHFLVILQEVLDLVRDERELLSLLLRESILSEAQPNLLGVSLESRSMDAMGESVEPLPVSWMEHVLIRCVGKIPKKFLGL